MNINRYLNYLLSTLISYEAKKLVYVKFINSKKSVLNFVLVNFQHLNLIDYYVKIKCVIFVNRDVFSQDLSKKFNSRSENYANFSI